MKKNVNILLIGGGNRYSLAKSFIKSGKKRNISINIFSYDLDEYNPISIIAKSIIGKKWESNEIIEDLEQKIKSLKIHIIIPCVDPAISLCLKLKDIIPKIFIATSNSKTCNILFNKQYTYDWALENSIPVAVPNKKSFPLIAKPIYGSASKGLIFINNKCELDQFLENHSTSEYNIQKFINGIEYSVDVYTSILNNKIISAVPRIRLAVSGGESVKSITVYNDRILKLTKQIVSKLKLKGPSVIQFIEDKKTQEIFLMEVNPRFGGAVICSIGAGADLPGYLLDDYLGKENKYLDSWIRGSLMVRYTKEYFKKI